jgi:hypothetical protein
MILVQQDKRLSGMRVPHNAFWIQKQWPLRFNSPLLSCDRQRFFKHWQQYDVNHNFLKNSKVK